MKKQVIAAMRGRDATNPSHRGKANKNYRQRLEINGGGTTNTLSTVAKDNLVIEYEEDNGDEVQIRQRTEQSD